MADAGRVLEGRAPPPPSDGARRVGGWMLGGSAVACGLGAFLLDATGSWPGVTTGCWIALVAGIGLGLVGALVVDHQPRNAAAWCLPACALLLALAGGLSALAGALDPAADGAVAARLLWSSAVAGSAATAGGGLFLFLFPAGRPPAGRTRGLWRLFTVSAGVLILPGIAIAAWSVPGPVLASQILDQPELSRSVEAGVGLRVAVALDSVLYGWWLVGAGRLLAMLRGAEGTVRRQLQWAVGGLVGTTALLVGGQVVGEWRVQILAPLPVCLGVLVAMRRYQLWDIERVLRRATVYVAVTLLLAGLYAAVVLTLTLAFSFGTARSPVAVAATTLAAAAAFAPLRRRLQALVDRRFDQRTWRAVQAVVTFTHRLREGARRPGEIEEALRTALGEPTLRVRYVDSAGGLIDIDGVPAEPDPTAGREFRMVATGGHQVAVVDLPAAFVADRPRLVTAVLTAAALPLENAALHARAAIQLADVQASRARLVEAADLERRRIERDLHDGAQQRLVALALRLRMAQLRLRDGEPVDVDLLGHSVDELRTAVDELRDLTRGLLPPVLAEEGLGIALGTLAARVPVPLRIDVPRTRFPDDVEATAWFVSCEGLANAVKHAGAGALRVAVRSDGASVRVEVTDDGKGGAAPTPGGGLQGLADRVAAIGGRFSVDSPTGVGTTIVAELPCAS